MTQSAGLDLIRYGINVNAIAPGVVDGEHWDGVDAHFAKLENRPLGEKKRIVGASVPIGRMARAANLTGMAIFLATAEADYIVRSEEHTSELQSLMRISYAVFCLKKKNQNNTHK